MQIVATALIFMYMGMAIFADKSLSPEKIAYELTPVYIFKNAPKDDVEYSFLAAWQQGNSQVKSEEDFKKVISMSLK